MPVSGLTLTDSKPPPHDMGEEAWRVYLTGELRSIKGQLGVLPEIQSDVANLKEHRTTQRARAGRVSWQHALLVAGFVIPTGIGLWKWGIEPERVARKAQTDLLNARLQIIDYQIRLLNRAAPSPIELPEFTIIPGGSP